MISTGGRSSLAAAIILTPRTLRLVAGQACRFRSGEQEACSIDVEIGRFDGNRHEFFPELRKSLE